jgi:hypothetical protein
MATPDRTHRWVADETSARDASRAFLGPVLARPRIWVFAALLEVALAVLLSDSVGSFGLALLVALVPTVLVIGVLLGTSYVRTRRTFRDRFAPGTELTAAFGRDAVVLRAPAGETSIEYADLIALHVAGAWVLLRRQGSPTVDTWPQALFPADELARVRRVLQAAQTR